MTKAESALDPSGFRQPEYSDKARKALGRKPALFINNEWVESTHDATLEVEDPSTKAVVARVVDASVEDVDAAVAAARASFDDGRWSGLAPSKRERFIHKLADLIEANAGELSELESLDNGKPIRIAGRVDIPACIEQLRYMAGWPSKLAGEQQAATAMPKGSMFSYVSREPVGVAAQIVPWNFPLLAAVTKIGPALAAGCTVVLKPAEQTCLTALRLADLIAEAGMPPGVVNIVTGNGKTAGDQLVKHPDVDKVAFTGSTQVGKLISRNASDSLKRVMLELGGKSPVVVMADANVEEAAANVAGGIFLNSGQTCVAGSRLFVHRSIFDKMLDRIATEAAGWKPRPSLDPKARMGPLVSSNQMERVLGFLEAGRRDGATVAIGGDSPASSGYYLNPTVLVDVSPSMSVVRDEIFGPVLVAQRFDDLSEVIKAANDTRFGLGASIWTKDVSSIHAFAAKVRAGTVWANCHGIIDPSLPFGGFKHSGVGREQGRQGIEAYTETKTVMIKL